MNCCCLRLERALVFHSLGEPFCDILIIGRFLLLYRTILTARLSSTLSLKEIFFDYVQRTTLLISLVIYRETIWQSKNMSGLVLQLKVFRPRILCCYCIALVCDVQRVQSVARRLWFEQQFFVFCLFFSRVSERITCYLRACVSDDGLSKDAIQPGSRYWSTSGRLKYICLNNLIYDVVVH